MDATSPESLPPTDWIAHCTEQLQLADPSLGAVEASNVALQLFSFERTAAMPPERAVAFVVAELASAAPRFERRSVARS